MKKTEMKKVELLGLVEGIVEEGIFYARINGISLNKNFFASAEEEGVELLYNNVKVTTLKELCKQYGLQASRKEQKDLLLSLVK